MNDNQRGPGPARGWEPPLHARVRGLPKEGQVVCVYVCMYLCIYLSIYLSIYLCRYCPLPFSVRSHLHSFPPLLLVIWACGHVMYVYGRAGARTATYIPCCAA